MGLSFWLRCFSQAFAVPTSLLIPSTSAYVEYGHPIFLNLYNISTSYMKANASELITLKPTTVHPLFCTALLLIMLAVSQIMWRMPL